MWIPQSAQYQAHAMPGVIASARNMNGYMPMHKGWSNNKRSGRNRSGSQSHSQTQTRAQSPSQQLPTPVFEQTQAQVPQLQVLYLVYTYIHGNRSTLSSIYAWLSWFQGYVAIAIDYLHYKSKVTYHTRTRTCGTLTFTRTRTCTRTFTFTMCVASRTTFPSISISAITAKTEA